MSLMTVSSVGNKSRYAKLPLTKSNCEKVLAVHCIKEHNGCDPDLSFDILTIQLSTHRSRSERWSLLAPFPGQDW